MRGGLAVSENVLVDPAELDPEVRSVEDIEAVSL